MSARNHGVADLSFGFSSSFMAPPAKRKRFSIGTQEEQQQCSVIKDTRVTQSQALRLNCPILTILVGPPEAQESFSVHEYVLTDHSPFFANAMKPEWASLRPDPKTIDLPDDDPAAFQLYMTWIYSKQLPILPESSVPSDSNTSAASTSSYSPSDPESGYHTLAYAYILGERLLDTRFKNALIDVYVLYARSTPPPGPNAQLAKRAYPSNEEIRILYSGTSEVSTIRKLLVDIWCCRGKWEWVEQDPELPSEFLAEVVKGLLKGRSGVEGLSRPWKNTHEQYHEKERAV